MSDIRQITMKDDGKRDKASGTQDLELSTPSSEKHSNENKPLQELPDVQKETTSGLENDEALDSKKPSLPEFELVPPDGGWGWLIALGAFINIMLVCAIIPCFSILFFYILVGFDVSSLMKGWILSLHSFLWNMAGPFAMPLVEEFGWRKISFAGFILVFSSFVISAYTPSADFMFFSFSLLNGVGCGIATCLSINIVPRYFAKRRGTSNAILMAGVSMGQILGPPFLRFLQEQYSGRGAIIIFSAIMLNGFVGSSLFHPVSWHMKHVQVERKSDETTDQSKSLIGKKALALGKTRGKLSPSSRNEEGYYSASDIPDSVLTANSVISDMYVSTGSLVEVRPKSVNSFAKKTQEVKPHYSSDLQNVTWKPLAIILRVMRSVISHLMVMRFRRAIIINLGIALVLISHINFCMILPFALQTIGHSLLDSSFAISVMGSCSLATRLIVSPLTDCHWFNMTICFLVGYAVMSTMMFALTFMESLTAIYIVMAIYGCGVGANASINSLIMIKYMGLEKLPAVFGASQLCIGVGFLCSGPIIGLIRDLTQSYQVAIRILAGMELCSLLIWILMPAAQAYDNKLESKDLE